MMFMYYNIFINNHISLPQPQYKIYILNVLLFLLLIFRYKMYLYIKHNNTNCYFFE